MDGEGGALYALYGSLSLRVINQNKNIMYYHVALTEGEGYCNYELDITEEDRVNEIVTQYVKGKKFRLTASYIDKKSFHEIVIVQSEEIASEFKNRINANREYPYVSAITALICEKQDTKDDITSKVFGRIEKMQKNQRGRKKSFSIDIAVGNKKVFIVHGHDDELKESAARLVEKIGLEAVILHEQANEGLTIIQKLEKQADVGYAIILYTPCDEGRKKGSEDSKPRARQNVVFEHGLFMGKLGSERVCALRKSEVEMPSDAQGILYIEVKEGSNDWMYQVAKELKKAGYDVDLNKI